LNRQLSNYELLGDVRDECRRKARAGENTMKKILIVDDDRDLVLALSIRLIASGYGVLSASDGAGAILAAAKGSPDLILLDIGIPGGNGIIVLNLLKDSPETASIPVVVLTGRNLAKVQDQILELGPVAFVQKPMATDELLALIQKHTGGGEQTAEAA
jgi:two-component system KDP operon response regulator KdpE